MPKNTDDEILETILYVGGLVLLVLLIGGVAVASYIMKTS
jgi:uncharacterized membrane protein